MRKSAPSWRAFRLSAVCVCLPLLGGHAARAQSTPPPEPAAASNAAPATKLACAQAYEASQRLRQSGKLIESRARAVACAQPECPAVLVGDCTVWLGELDRAIPSVVVELTDARGQPTSAGALSVDGQLVSKVLDGRALSLDPGQHSFRIDLPNGSALTKQITINEAQKAQSVRFEASKQAVTSTPAASQPARGRFSPLMYGAATAGALGTAGFALFGLSGRATQRELEQQCAPRCRDAQLAPVRRNYVAADISLGVGAVALGVLGYLWFKRPSEPDTALSASWTREAASLSVERRF